MHAIGRRGLLAAGLACPASASGLPPRRVVANAAATGQPFFSAEFDTVGVFDADWLTDRRYARLLDTMAASPGAFGGVRVFGVLNAGTREDDFPTAPGRTWTNPARPPDFTASLRALDALVARGLVPFLALTFFPPAVSAHQITPPPDLRAWQDLVRAFLRAATARFGTAEVARWWLECWNEPNMPQFWRGTFDAYLDLYSATAQAVREAGYAARLGGPAIAWLPDGSGPALMERFLQVLAAEPELPCAFLSFHRKGAWDDGEAEPHVARLTEAAEATAALALRLVPERCARGLAIINNEADMRVGFQRPYAPRLSERFPAWLAAVATEHAALSLRHAARGLRFMAFADNANQHLVREPFDGRRALMTPTAAGRPDDLIKLPVFGFYEMLRLLRGGVCAAEASGDGLFHLVTADEAGIAALLVLHPVGVAAGATEIEWVLRDIPWRRANFALLRVDGAHANAFAAAGARTPAPPIGAAAARRLRHAAELTPAAPLRHGMTVENGQIVLRLRLDPFATALAWITPFDAAPPATPRRIEARRDAGNTVLRWEPNREPGLLGYEVSRLDSRSGVTPPLLRGATWVDTAPSSAAPRYAVRAVSTSGIRSAAVRS